MTGSGPLEAPPPLFRRPVVPAVLTIVLTVSCIVVLVLFWNDADRLDSLGSFLSGTVSAVAFVWLVEAYRAQRHELRLQRDEMYLTRKELAAQAQAQQNTVIIELRGAFLDALGHAVRKLVRALGLDNDEIAGCEARYVHGDKLAYTVAVAQSKDLQQRLKNRLKEEDPLIIGLAHSFLEKHATFTALLAKYDRDGVLQMALLDSSPVGDAARLVRKAVAESSATDLDADFSM